jgi:hypothetical protein
METINPKQKVYILTMFLCLTIASSYSYSGAFFRAKYGIEEMCRDQWNWASNNPWGYQSKP